MEPEEGGSLDGAEIQTWKLGACGEVDEKLAKKEPARQEGEDCPGGGDCVKKLGVGSCVRSCCEVRSAERERRHWRSP